MKPSFASHMIPRLTPARRTGGNASAATSRTVRASPDATTLQHPGAFLQVDPPAAEGAVEVAGQRQHLLGGRARAHRQRQVGRQHLGREPGEFRERMRPSFTGLAAKRAAGSADANRIAASSSTSAL